MLLLISNLWTDKMLARCFLFIYNLRTDKITRHFSNSRWAERKRYFLGCLSRNPMSETFKSPRVFGVSSHETFRALELHPFIHWLIRGMKHDENSISREMEPSTWLTGTFQLSSSFTGGANDDENPDFGIVDFMLSPQKNSEMGSGMRNDYLLFRRRWHFLSDHVTFNVATQSNRYIGSSLIFMNIQGAPETDNTNKNIFCFGVFVCAKYYVDMCHY